MAYISFQPSDFFNTKLYTGTAGASQSYTGLGFSPDFVWAKSRTAANYAGAWDTVRGVEKLLWVTVNNAQSTTTDGVSAFGADGITFGANGSIGDSSNFVNWCWKAGTTSGIAGSPSITPTSYSFNATSGFSIIKYVGNGTAGATLPHGLGVAPEMILIKDIDETMDWVTYNKPIGNTDYMVLNTTAAAAASITRWNNTTPGATLFTIGDTDKLNTDTINYIAYCFAPVKGYSKFGSYAGNGNADGTFVYTGFRPAFVITKKSSGTGVWSLFDNKRLGYNPDNEALYADSSDTEATGDWLDILSNGFKLRTTNANVNTGAADYIYAAFAEFPLVSSNSKAGTAR